LAVKPTDALTKNLSLFLDGLDSDGVLDETYLLAPVGFDLETNEQRLKPLKTTSGDDLEAVNSPTIAATGITGNGTTSYIDLKWNMAVDAPVAAQDNISFAVWCEDNITEDALEMGVIGAAFSNQSLIGKKYTGTLFTYYSLNDISNYGVAHDDTAEYYFLSIVRNSATNRDILRGNLVVESAANSVAIPNFDVFGCAGNNAGTPAFFSTKEQRLFFIGSGSVRTWQLRQRLKYLDILNA
jgi:hypothetical protein